MYDELVLSYNHFDIDNEYVKKKDQSKKLDLQNRIQKQILKAYNAHNPKIAHYYNNRNYTYVPIWAVFEILMLGDFGFLISYLDKKTREKISRKIYLNLSSDTNIEAIYKIIYVIKDIRNAIAHNDVIYDTRFNNTEVTKPVKRGIEVDIGLTYINFNSIIDYLILICYLLDKLGVKKDEINYFIKRFEDITVDYEKDVGELLFDKTVHRDTNDKLEKLKKFIKNH